ncbi:hypothetical protein MTO96_051011 [Rhipicephalus appendiculatus]
MKFPSAIFLFTLLAVFLVVVSAAEEGGEESEATLGHGRGCPDIVTCLESCQKKGFTAGVCRKYQKLRACVCF